MATIIGTLPVTLQNGTIADATQVMTDFNWIVNQVNSNGQSAFSPPSGVLLNVQVFGGGGTYTPNASATKAIVKAIGGGGAGGSCTFTSSTTVALGLGGYAGAYGEMWISSGLTSQTVTIGAAGAPAAAGNNQGGSGGNTSFGALMVCAGGIGGIGGAGATPPFIVQFGTTGAGVTGSGNIIVAGRGALSKAGIALAANVANAFVGGCGADTQWGQGGLGAGSAQGTGFNAVGFGAGGGGAGGTANGVGFAGGAGGQGLLLVFEYA